MSEENKNINSINSEDINETNEINEPEKSYENRFEALFSNTPIDGGAPEEEEVKPKKKKRISVGAFIVSTIAIVLAAVMITWTASTAFYRRQLSEIADGLGSNVSFVGSSENFKELELLRSIIEQYSYFGIEDEEQMIDAVLKAYISATGDKYAEYFNEEEFKAYISSASGNTEGVGINIIYTTEKIGAAEYKVLKVINVGRSSPARDADVRVGDLIFYVGSDKKTRQTIDELGYEEALSKLVGKAGTTAEFTVLRKNSEGGYDEIAFSVVRQSIISESVYSHVSTVDNSVGIVKIMSFDYNTPAQFSQAVDELLDKGVEKFVFDVRYNGGGALCSIVAVLSYFLDEGQTIISTVDKDGNADKTTVGVVKEYSGDTAACNVSRSDIGKYKDLKVAVLCNESTASAAELFTATFRDYKLGKTVGVTTFGKGSMQSIMSLDYFGYGGAIKLTTNMYFPTCGESYEGIGIVPDVEVALDESLADVNIYDIADKDDNQLLAAIATFN